jgi:hypothetical protein
MEFISNTLNSRERRKQISNLIRKGHLAEITLMVSTITQTDQDLLSQLISMWEIFKSIKVLLKFPNKAILDNHNLGLLLLEEDQWAIWHLQIFLDQVPDQVSTLLLNLTLVVAIFLLILLSISLITPTQWVCLEPTYLLTCQT